jgi:hypothetical protein
MRLYGSARFLPAASAILLCCTFGARADEVKTMTGDGFGRLYFTLDPPAHVKTALEGGVLTITFDRKVDIPSQAVAQGLGAYASSVREDADQRAIHIALSQSIRLHTSSSGVTIAVDLVPETYSGLPPDLPPPPPKDDQAVDVSQLAPLPIRAGVYSSYSRLVFDWPRNVPYTVFRGAGHVTLRFEALARPEFAALSTVAPPWVKETGWRIDGKDTLVELKTDPASAARDFRDGTKIVLDVLAPSADAAADKIGANGNLDDKSAAAASAAQADAVLKAAAALREEDVGNGSGGQKIASQSSATVSPGPAAQSASPVNSAGVAAAPPPTQVAPTDAGWMRRTRDSVLLDFPNAATVPVAAFVRGTTAWIVLDGLAGFDPKRLSSMLGGLPFAIASENGTSVLRISLKQPEQIGIGAFGSDLRVILAPRVQEGASAIGFVRGEDPAHQTLETVLPGASHALNLADPAAGDTLVVVPALLGRATQATRSFGEFVLLPTAAGLAVTPFGDDVSVMALQGRVTITRPHGLALAAVSQMSVDSPAGLLSPDASPSFLDFVRWRSAAGSSFLEAQRRLRGYAASARPEEAAPERLQLAKLYLSNEYAAEALGLINRMQSDNAALQSDPQILVMRAAAEYMLGRYVDARNELAGSRFDGDRHAAVWRGLIEAAQWNWEAARKAFAQAAGVLNRYPKDWQARVLIADARAELAGAAIEAADADISRLPPNLPRSLALEAELVRAELNAAEGRYQQAHDMLHGLADADNEQVGAEAAYADVEAGLAAGAMSRQAAIDALERLRFRWRGDALELATLRKLGDLYFASQHWHDGFATLRVAARNFGNDERARAAEDDMRATFEKLFIKDKADRLSPVQALGLFYDFVDLTPIGPDGDDLIRHMADRLVAVDLLEPAAALLRYQVTHRLDGIARAQVATRLAMIDLMDHNPKDALDALRTTEVTGLPPDDVHARMILGARALAALRQWSQALDMIATDDAPDSRQLRADIYWESGNWDLAGQKAEELSASADLAAPLSREARQEIMRAAIAYSLADDEAGLERLRDSFATKMSASPDSSAFAVVTQSIDTHGTAFRDTAAQIASIDTLENFMQDFRKRYDSARMTN